MRNLISWIKSYFRDIYDKWLLNRKYKRRIKAFDYAKKLADLKYKSNGKRYYVFDDKYGGYAVLNKHEMHMVYLRTKIKFYFMHALYKTD